MVTQLNSFIADMDWCTMDFTEFELKEIFKSVYKAYHTIDDLEKVLDGNHVLFYDVNLSSLISDLVYNGLTKEVILEQIRSIYGIELFYLSKDDIYCMAI